MMNVQSKMS